MPEYSPRDRELLQQTVASMQLALNLLERLEEKVDGLAASVDAMRISSALHERRLDELERVGIEAKSIRWQLWLAVIAAGLSLGVAVVTALLYRP